jgi:hypothetical protein
MLSPLWETDRPSYRYLWFFHLVLYIFTATLLVVLFFARVPRTDFHLSALEISLTVVVAAMILVRMADQMLKRALYTEEIDRLIDDAKDRLKGRDKPLYRKDQLQLYTIGFSAGIVIFGMVVISWEVWAPLSRPVWFAVIVITLAELVILAWVFEHVAMKHELEALAVARRDKVSSSPMAKLDMDVAKRVHELIGALDITASDQEDREIVTG